jgi:4,5-DOPA dioxygenase extradiol
MPAVFSGHGNPMNAVLRNQYTEAWTAIGTKLPRPKAILSISAHWYIQDAAVTVALPRGRSTTSAGFRENCTKCNIRHPVPELAARVQKLLAPLPVRLD